MATAIFAVIATALDVVVDNIVAAIVEPRVRFPTGTSNMCLTHCHLSYSVPDALLYA